MHPRMLLAMAISTSAAFGIGACGSDAAPATDGGVNAGKQTVEIFSWWTAPGEAEALQALFDLQKKNYPKESMFNAAAKSGTDAHVVLEQRLAAKLPPDLFQENAHDIAAFLTENPGSLATLDDLFEKHGLYASVVPEVISHVRIDGHIYAMPVNIHRENSLIYNQKIFAANDIKPPTSMAELLAACQKLKAAGITPIATSYQGWIQRIMFNSIAMSKMGARTFNDYFTGKLAADDSGLKSAIAAYAEILEKYTNQNAGDADFGWTNAALAVHDGSAAMYFHGDWAKGYLVQLGWTPGVDFGVVGAPGASELFLYGVDVFALPMGAKNADGARDFLSTVASEAGQLAFNKIKGSSPMRVDVDKTMLDAPGRAALEDLDKAEIRMLVPGRDVWDTAFAQFALDRKTDVLFKVFVDNPPAH
jgi:glucose/mannose transport system substrate-binding protein